MAALSGWRAGACFGLLALAAAPAPAARAGADPAVVGQFAEPFAEPEIDGQRTDENCIEEERGYKDCKPTAGSVALLPNGRVLYWNAQEGTENVQLLGYGGDLARVSVNDQSRVLDLDGEEPAWLQPDPVDGGANPDGYAVEPLVPGLSDNAETGNDGLLSCSDLTFLPDGRLLAAGGDSHFNDPGHEALPGGFLEFQGLRNTRVYDPDSNTWSQTGSLRIGRWYPSIVELGDGRVLIASGVQKLVKPIYRSRPGRSLSNVRLTETYDPATGEWSPNGRSASRSLPLYPRLHLLPDGHVLYNGDGMAWSAFGEAWDEARWNLAAAYDPAAGRWRTLGLAGAGGETPGFRGSGFSVPLVLRPDPGGRYTRMELLAGGGVLGVTPGTYLAQRSSAITTVDTAGDLALRSRATGPLVQPRWLSSAVLLPTGEVAAFSGADRDHVVAPGLERAVTQAELFDPASRTWKPLASARRARTYHATAALLPDGRVLVGGHAPNPTLYGSHRTVPGGFAPNEGRDPTFELYSPPYLFRGPRPTIRSAPERVGYGGELRLATDVPADEIERVVLLRNGSETHAVDGDQRGVELRVLSRRGRVLRLAAPPSGNVAPPGPYLLFANRAGDSGPVPSVGRAVMVG